MTETLTASAPCQHAWVRMTNGLGGAAEMCQLCGTVVRISTTSSAGPCQHNSWLYLTDPMGQVIGRTCTACGDAVNFSALPFDKRLRDLAEKAIVQGKAEAGVKALEPIAEPKVDTTGQRNLGKQF